MTAAIRRDGLDEELQDGPPLLAQASDHREHPLHEPGSFKAVGAEAALAPQYSGADFLLADVVGGLDVIYPDEDP